MPRTTAEPDEARISAVRGSKRQDPNIPFLINVNDARLVPNTKLTRRKKEYIPYLGKVADDLPTRQQFLQYGQRRRVINSMPDLDVFDVGTADADALVAFAFDEYGIVLQATTPIKTLRKQVMKMAEVGGQAGAATSVAPPRPTGIGAALTAGAEPDDMTS